MTKINQLLNKTISQQSKFFHKQPFAHHTQNTTTAPQNAHTPHSVHGWSNTTTQASTRQKTANNSKPQVSLFDTDNKPNPVSFYASYGYQLKGKQTSVKCCFHQDKTPSLSINKDTGAFYCFGCGASGGDVLDFYQQYHQCDFITACQQLNLSPKR